MKAEYLAALEKQSEWLRWSRSPAGVKQWQTLFTQDPNTAAASLPHAAVQALEQEQYEIALRSGAMFYVADHFCAMVEHARKNTPTEMRFEAEWLQAQNGFLWLDHLMTLPRIAGTVRTEDMRLADTRIAVRAIGWRRTRPGEAIRRAHVSQLGWSDEIAPEGTYQFLIFQDRSTPLMRDSGEIVNIGGYQIQNGFWPLSYFAIRDGDILSERIAAFEGLREAADDSKYVDDLWRHEMQLVFTLFKLMSQRITVHTQWPVDRPSRRRAAAAGREVPEHIKVITLRRFEDRQKQDPDHEPKKVDWQWQWDVIGHWRDQWYPSEAVHKAIWIDDFIKGPPDKPFKADQRRVYVAAR